MFIIFYIKSRLASNNFKQNISTLIYVLPLFYLISLVSLTVSSSGNSLKEHCMTPCPPLGPVGPWKRPSLTMSVVSLKFHLFLSPVDSEKSLSPLVDETQPFTVPFRPYAWSSYPGPGLRPLVPQSLHPGVEVDRGPAALAFYGDRSSAHPALYSERALGEEAYGDYRRHAAALLFPEGGLHAKSHGVKGQSDLLCSSLILNGAYKCVKCSKVRTANTEFELQETVIHIKRQKCFLPSV